MVPVLIYAAEAWILTENDERMLGMLHEMKVLRTIYGPVFVVGDSRTYYNQDIFVYKDS